ncbi:hypothetical protein [Siccirubricoccus sp. G192]|uniref:hypothetical protein n=1 Tax=Siccirubricoccus sp. G192 TaxID=2849651 RepID=UPI001C2C3D93|nr:hypothetical protein [Siccirubricoccus sp. G192]MBV1797522.1 hypothetical protein [Siccirubricoccus sp. G192]
MFETDEDRRAFESSGMAGATGSRSRLAAEGDAAGFERAPLRKILDLLHERGIGKTMAARRRLDADIPLKDYLYRSLARVKKL